jgi:hypothetical protein
VADSDTIPACFDFGREQPRSALSASTASDTFSMHSLSTNGSCSDDLDELLTWLDKDGTNSDCPSHFLDKNEIGR